MNVRRRTAASRPRTANPTTLALGSSTTGWYAGWKSRKQAAVAAAPAPGTAPAADAAEAVAKWLTGRGA